MKLNSIWVIGVLCLFLLAIFSSFSFGGINEVIFKVTPASISYPSSSFGGCFSGAGCDPATKINFFVQHDGIDYQLQHLFFNVPLAPLILSKNYYGSLKIGEAYSDDNIYMSILYGTSTSVDNNLFFGNESVYSFKSPCYKVTLPGAGACQMFLFVNKDDYLNVLCGNKASSSYLSDYNVLTAIGYVFDALTFDCVNISGKIRIYFFSSSSAVSETYFINRNTFDTNAALREEIYTKYSNYVPEYGVTCDQGSDIQYSDFFINYSSPKITCTTSASVTVFPFWNQGGN